MVLLIVFVMGCVLPATIEDNLDGLPPYIARLLASLNLPAAAVDFMVGCVAVLGLLVFLTYTVRRRVRGRQCVRAPHQRWQSRLLASLGSPFPTFVARPKWLLRRR